MQIILTKVFGIIEIHYARMHLSITNLRLIVILEVINARRVIG